MKYMFGKHVLKPPLYYDNWILGEA
jgi:hypothetical protein